MQGDSYSELHFPSPEAAVSSLWAPAAQASLSVLTRCPLHTLAFVPWGHSGLGLFLLGFQTFPGNRTGAK